MIIDVVLFIIIIIIISIDENILVFRYFGLLTSLVNMPAWVSDTCDDCFTCNCFIAHYN